MAGVRLEFAQFGHFDYFNIYRNPVSTDKENLGQPIGTSSTMYFEDFNAEPNLDYFYRVGVVNGQAELISDEIYIRTEVMFNPPYNLIININAKYLSDTLTSVSSIIKGYSSGMVDQVTDIKLEFFNE